MAFEPPDSVFVVLTVLIVLFGGTVAFLCGYFLPSKFTEEGFQSKPPTDGKEQEQEQEPKIVELESKVEESILSDDEPSHRKLDNTRSPYNWLASVNMYRYEDMPSSLEFFCAGTILTSDRMITGESCCREHFIKEDLEKAVVRSDSLYFWTGGTTHSVINIMQNTKLRDPYKQVYVFKVTPTFAMLLTKPKLVAAPSVRRLTKNDGKFILVGWGGEQDQTEQISQRKPFDTYEWYTENLVSCKGNPCHKSSLREKICCNEAIITDKPVIMQGPVSGRVLVKVGSEAPQLIALELIHVFKGSDTVEKDLSYFVDIGDSDFMTWLQGIAPDAFIKLDKNFDNGKTEKIIYSQCETSRYINDMKYFSQYNPLAKYIPIEASEYNYN